MPSLIPTHASSHVVGGLSEYLATSFSLAENTTAASLKDFLTDPEGGMFHGPYVRTRLPYAPATDWEDALGWLPEGFTPYRHQAEAFRRLASSEKGQPRRPEPTLVVTGTGSGKTESFLYPIIDHCLRTIGTTGIKALILYPMNALANDQAARLAELLTTDPKLRGIRAGLYTGEASTTARQTVSDAGLITDRDAMRDAPPDILLTNYKMLDQLLLRGEDRPLWERSATSLQYVVLDEFHTYDGAQGTDVALLLRRMGLTIKALQPEGFLSDADSTRPLGRITPVATSATLGDNSGGGTPSEMLDFAHTIFGEPLEPGAVVRETMLTIPQWQEAMAKFTGITAEPTGAPDVALIQEINAAIEAGAGAGAGAGEAGAGAEDGAGDGEADAHSDTVHRVLCDKLFGLPTATPSIDEAVAAAANNEWVLTVLRTTLRPVALGDASASAALTGTGVGGAGGTGGSGNPGDTSDSARTLERIVFTDEQRRQLGEGAVTFLAHTLSEIAYLRAAFGALHGREGKKFPGVETHLWVREVSRIDRAVELDVTGPEMFRWSDNGTATGNWLPACYCRNCGRSGWMTAMQPGDEFVETNVKKIRYQGLRKPSLQRPLIDASSEARTGHTRVADDDSILAWLDLPNAALTTTQPDEESEDLGGVVPVLTYSPDTADEKARQDVCPSCGESDAIRYLGSSVATLLSVAVSNLFGMDELDASEKKSLVFTDSVQDAAHRAGFMQSRARTFAFRGRTNAVTRAMAGGRTTLDKLPALLIASANNDAVPDRARFELLPPWVTENKRFEPFWDPAATTAQREEAERKLARVLELDIALEFGDRADLTRSLVSTGTLSVGVDVDESELAELATEAASNLDVLFLDKDPATGEALAGSGTPLAWARGVLEYMRLSGGIYADLLHTFIQDDGNSYMLHRREAAAKGVPKFPIGGAPHFPRDGKQLKNKRLSASTLPVGDPRGWFARWTASHLSVPTHQASHLVTALFRALANNNILDTLTSNSGATMYFLRPQRILIQQEDHPQILECSVCHRRFGVDRRGREILAGTPCHSLGCEGHFEIVNNPDNYYRSLYGSRDSRTVIAREHTGLLDPAERLEIEDQFKAPAESQAPNAPNVLVATPTLEMGIDIGDLSTVMLASLPDTVASYVQRVGRAGRLTGNSLVIAVIRGRGKALARLERPLDTINGVVQPPAAFLSAREILHRQFLAYVVDTMDFAALGIPTHRATSVFGTHPTSESTVINALVARLAEGVDELLDAFIASLSPFASDAVTDELRTWANGHAAASIEKSKQDWHANRQLIKDRRAAVGTILDDLEKAAADGGGTFDEEMEQQLRSTRAAWGFLTKQLRKEFEDEYWIAALERWGLLPNFTLLDESVEFHLSISRTDADTGQIETSAREYSRGISSALFELAPDATFYVQGIAATVDSVELGPEKSAVQTWRLCPTCSYSRVEGPESTPEPCPTCGEPRFADAAQVKKVVEMSKVYASVDYSRSAITDARDDRSSVRFEQALSMVVPDNGYGESWFLTGTGFGIRYVPSVEMRWLNLGRAVGGVRETLCGEDVEAPLFRVCRECGYKDSEAGANRWQDHKPWCSLRNADEEDAIEFALGRRLTTQGVLMHLPASISAADDNATTSLIAAVRMGFKLALGGNPDHLDVARVYASTHGKVSPMLLLHDTIPGGTGYLAQFTSSKDIRRLLVKAYTKLAECSCQHDQRLACPECLLPFTAGSDVDKTSRESAMSAIAKILLDDLHPEVDADPLTAEDVWDKRLTSTAPELSDRTQLEVMFLEQLRADLKKMDATVTEQTMGNYARWTISFPGSPHQWFMQEQKDFGFTRPDFYFETDNASVNKLAVYLDGYQFHASQYNNSVASDMAKRKRLTEEGIEPWSMTMQDLQARKDTARGAGSGRAPRWFDHANRQRINTLFTIQDTDHELLLRDPMTQLLEMLRRPTAPWRQLGGIAALHTMASMAQQGPRFMGPSIDLRNVNNHLEMDFLVSSGGSNREIWNEFLQLSNLVLLDPTRATVDVRSTGAAEGAAKGAAEGTVKDAAEGAAKDAVEVPERDTGGDRGGVEHKTHPNLADMWDDALTEFDDEEDVTAAIRVLAEAGVRPPDDVGAEVNGVATIVTWRAAGEGVDAGSGAGERVALVFDGDGDQLSEPWVAVEVSEVGGEDGDQEGDRVPEVLRRLSTGE